MQLSLYTWFTKCSATELWQAHLTESETENRTFTWTYEFAIPISTSVIYALHTTNSLDTNHNKIVINKSQIKQIAH